MNISNEFEQKIKRSFSYFIRFIIYDENISDYNFPEPIIIKEFNFHICSCNCIECFSNLNRERFESLFSIFYEINTNFIKENNLSEIELAKLIYNQYINVQL